MDHEDGAVSDEMLMAYADGELEPAQARALEAVLERRPELRRRAELFAATRDAARAAYDPLLAEPVPARLVAAARGARAAGPATAPRARRGLPRVPSLARLPLAAGVALLLGLGAGYALGRLRPPDAPAASDPLAAALGSVPSGRTAPLPDRDAGAGRVLLLATFRDRAGRLCREYEILPGAAAAYGAACRSAGGGGWTIEAHVPAALAAGLPETGGDTYAPAAADGRHPADALAHTLGAGGPLPPEEEEALIRRGWR